MTGATLSAPTDAGLNHMDNSLAEPRQQKHKPRVSMMTMYFFLLKVKSIKAQVWFLKSISTVSAMQYCASYKGDTTVAVEKKITLIFYSFLEQICFLCKYKYYDKKWDIKIKECVCLCIKTEIYSKKQSVRVQE